MYLTVNMWEDLTDTFHCLCFATSTVQYYTKKKTEIYFLGWLQGGGGWGGGVGRRRRMEE